MLNNSMNPLKYVQIYIYVEFPTYRRLRMVIRMKFKAVQDVGAVDARNRYGSILLLQQSNISNFLSSQNGKYMIW